jgi:hypothetical protein
MLVTLKKQQRAYYSDDLSSIYKIKVFFMYIYFSLQEVV